MKYQILIIASKRAVDHITMTSQVLSFDSMIAANVAYEQLQQQGWRAAFTISALKLYGEG